MSSLHASDIKNILVARLIETGKLSLKDVKEAERTLRRLAKKDTLP